MRPTNRRAQSTAEYAIVIALVIAATVAMQIYVRRGLSTGIKFVTDKLKSSDSGTGQFEPDYIESTSTTARSAMSSSEEVKEGGELVREIGRTGAGETTTRTYIQKTK